MFMKFNEKVIVNYSEAYSVSADLTLKLTSFRNLNLSLSYVIPN